MANETIYSLTGGNNAGYDVQGVGYFTGAVYVGSWDSGAGIYIEDGAMRFTNLAININDNCSRADLVFYASVSNGSGTVRTRITGIDEDNTADLGSNPFSRTSTTAYVDNEFGDFGDGTPLTIGVSSIVNEIVSRGGWSSGNALGFLIRNNGSDSGRDMGDAAGTGSYLAIRIAAEPDFTPGPYTVRMGTKPPKELFGMKMSQPGHNVKQDEVEVLYFTSGRQALKVHEQGLKRCLATGTKVRHNLPYVAPALVFGKSGERAYLFNRLDPSDSLTGEGYTSCNRGYITIYSAGDCYYYIFVDPLDE